MKRGTDNRKGEVRMKKLLKKALTAKVVYYLLALATLGLLLAESVKWRPGGGG
jgi:hypothetical protein